MPYPDQRVDHLHPGTHPQPVIGGVHVPARDLAGPVPRYRPNPPGSLAALTRRPEASATLDGTAPLVLLELPPTVVAGIARAVHRGAGIDGARMFARLAAGDEEAGRALLRHEHVRDALTLTITLDEGCELLADLDDALVQAGHLAREAEAGRREVNPDDARDLLLDDELLDAGERPEL